MQGPLCEITQALMSVRLWGRSSHTVSHTIQQLEFHIRYGNNSPPVYNLSPPLCGYDS